MRVYIFHIIILVDICIYQLCCWHSVSHCKGKIEMLIDIYLMSHWATSFAAILGIFLLSKAATLMENANVINKVYCVFIINITAIFGCKKCACNVCFIPVQMGGFVTFFYTLGVTEIDRCYLMTDIFAVN